MANLSSTLVDTLMQHSTCVRVIHVDLYAHHEETPHVSNGEQLLEF